MGVAAIDDIRKNRLPWFMFDDTNGIFITSPTIPTSISDQKQIVFAESAVPGLNYTPIFPNHLGNTKLAFTLPIINRKGLFGNADLMQQFESLRNQDKPSLLGLLLGRGYTFRNLPTVIYNWGTHRPPLRWFVKVADFDHNSTLTNRFGLSQYTMVNVDLELDENSYLYRGYSLSRMAGALIGSIHGISQVIEGRTTRPY